MTLRVFIFLFTFGFGLGLITYDENSSNANQRLNVALIQFTAVNGNVPANLDLFEEYAKEKHNDTQILVFPELSLVGYSLYSEIEILELAEPVNGPSMQHIMKIARTYDVYIAYGYIELGESNTCSKPFPPFENNVYDTYAIISPDGDLLLNYRKTHLATGAEEKLFTRGGVIGGVIDISGVKIGVMICFEVYYPEIARELALQGAQMILAPTANAYPPTSPGNVTDPGYNIPAYVVVPSRAAENNIPVCYVNYFAPKNVFYTFHGMTVLYDKRGNLLAWGGNDNSTVIYYSVEIESTTPQSERRPPLYSSICSDNDYSYCTDPTSYISVPPYP